jgi:hypothetical protein
MTSKTAYLELIEACKQPGCPICYTSQKAVEHYLNILFYEQVNDGWVRHELRESLGFCHEHAWLASDSEVGDALGLAMIYHDVFSTILKGLPNKDPSHGPLQKISTWFQQIPRDLIEKIESVQFRLTPQGPCLACKLRDRSTGNVISLLIESLQDEQMIDAISSSNGLCLPHLRQAFKQVTNEQDYDKLLSFAREKLVSLDSELSEFIRKNDYRFLPGGFGSEGDSWKRAVMTAVGNNKVNK